MDINVGVLKFSPTGGTARICDAVARGITDKESQSLSLTLPGERSMLMGNPEDIVDSYDLIVAGVPVYAGKIPSFIRPFLESIPGKGKPVVVVVVVVFGNNEFGKALFSLTELLSANGFKVVAAGAFIAEHTYSGDPEIARGRPDAPDLQKAEAFGAGIRVDADNLAQGSIPQEPGLFSGMKSVMSISPVYNTSNCRHCGTCTGRCPTGIIGPDGSASDKKSLRSCLGCLSCVKACEYGGRVFNPSVMQKFLGNLILKKAAENRREPVFVSA